MRQVLLLLFGVVVAHEKVVLKWSTPIYYADLWDSQETADEVNKELSEAAIYLEKHIRGVYKSNSGGYQSQVYNSFSPHGLDILHKVEVQVIKAAKEFYLRGLQTDVSFDDQVEREKNFLDGKSGVLELFSIWFNVNRDNDSNHAHSHSDCFLSGAYYIAVDGSSLEEPAPIVLSDPRSQPATNFDYSGWFGMNQNHFIDPKPGKVILFPSWLSHRVEPAYGDAPRISVAFNIRMRARHVAGALASSDACENDNTCAP